MAAWVSRTPGRTDDGYEPLRQFATLGRTQLPLTASVLLVVEQVEQVNALHSCWPQRAIGAASEMLIHKSTCYTFSLRPLCLVDTS